MKFSVYSDLWESMFHNIVDDFELGLEYHSKRSYEQEFLKRGIIIILDPNDSNLWIEVEIPDENYMEIVLKWA